MYLFTKAYVKSVIELLDKTYLIFLNLLIYLKILSLNDIIFMWSGDFVLVFYYRNKPFQRGDFLIMVETLTFFYSSLCQDLKRIYSGASGKRSDLSCNQFYRFTFAPR